MQELSSFLNESSILNQANLSKTCSISNLFQLSTTFSGNYKFLSQVLKDQQKRHLSTSSLIRPVIHKILFSLTMLDLDILTSDSDLELDAIEETKPRKKYEVSRQNLSLYRNYLKIFFLQFLNSQNVTHCQMDPTFER